MLFFSPEPNFLRLELTFMQYSATGCAILQLTLDWRRAHEAGAVPACGRTVEVNSKTRSVRNETNACETDLY